jgi:hypothetical protein
MLLDLSDPMPPPNFKLLMPPKEKTPNTELLFCINYVYEKNLYRASFWPNFRRFFDDFASMPGLFSFIYYAIMEKNVLDHITNKKC